MGGKPRTAETASYFASMNCKKPTSGRALPRSGPVPLVPENAHGRAMTNFRVRMGRASAKSGPLGAPIGPKATSGRLWILLDFGK